jgi:hypothetical protein
MRRRGLAHGLVVVASAIVCFGSACADRHVDKTNAAPAPSETVSAETAEAPSAAPSASASASAKPDAGPPKPVRPLVRAIDPPDESKSPLPKLAEWTDVPRRAVVDRGRYDCTIQHVREWHRITCSCTNATVALVGGDRNGVSVWSTATEAQLFFPVRKGDARAFEVTPHAHTVVIQNAGPYGNQMFEEEGGPPVVISETWLEGEDHPTLVIQ